MIALKQILVATDFSECSDAAVRYARELGAVFGAGLHLLHVLPNPYAEGWSVQTYTAPCGDLLESWDRDARARLVESLPEADRARATMATKVGPADQRILEYARDEAIDLIVIGTHGRGALGHLLLGSVAERVVRRAPCPVLTVHHPQREFVAA